MSETKPRLTLFCLGSNLTCIGPRRMAGYLKSKGIDVRMVFVPCDKKFVSSLDDTAAGQLVDLVKGDCAVAFSFYTNHLIVAQQLTALIKKTFSIPVLWGGVHTTAAPEESILLNDTICLGEGEDALLDWVKAIAQGNTGADILNLWSRQGDTVMRNPQRPLINDLDSLPFQDYDLSTQYLLLKDRVRNVTPADLKKNFGFSLTRMMTFGCPYRCTYCINDRYQALYEHHARMRHYSVDYFINETNHLLKAMPFIHYLMLDDDAFLSLPEKIIDEFCVKWKARVNLPFGIGGIRPEAVTEGKLKKLIDAGLITVRMGIQSGSVRTNEELFLRHFSREKILSAARIFKTFGARLRPSFFDVIVDNPWETMDDRFATLDLLQEMPKPYFLGAFSLTLYPGTRLYEKALQEKMIERFDPNKHFYVLKQNAINLLLVFSSFIRYPRGWYKKAVGSAWVRNEEKTFPLLHKLYVGINLIVRLITYYTNVRFIKSHFRKTGTGSE